MDRRLLARLAVPLVVLIGVLAAPAYLNSAGPAAIPGESARGVRGYEDLTPLLPDGVDRITAAAGSGDLLLLAENAAGDPMLLAHRVQEAANDSVTYLPSHYAMPEVVAHAGSRFVVAGESLGSAPAMGVYDAATETFHDLPGLLPADTTGVEAAVGGESAFLLLSRGRSALAAGMLDAGGLTYAPLDAPGLEGVARVHHGVWNGTAFHLGGEGVGGEPLLISLDPASGALADLSMLLPPDMERLERLLWIQEELYLLGTRTPFLTTRASMAVYTPSTGSMRALSGNLPGDTEALSLGTWNGTALLLLARAGSDHALVSYHPSNETAVVHEDVIPPAWTYVAMVPEGDRVTFVGEDDGPIAGVLHTSTWTWEERRRVFDTALREIHDLDAAGGNVFLTGTRRHAAELGRLNLSSDLPGRFSGLVDLAETTVSGVARGGDGYLLAGADAGGAVLYDYDPVEETIRSLTASLPEGVQTLHAPAWNGEVYVIPGSAAGRAALLLYNPDGEVVEDLSQTVQLYFTRIEAAASFGGEFVLMGGNGRGAALATVDPRDGRIVYPRSALADQYGGSGILLHGAWSGQDLMVGGASSEGPILGLWSPAKGGFRDLSALLPSDVTGIHRIAWDGRSFYVGGAGVSGAALAMYHPANGTLEDLHPLLPPTATTVTALEPLEGRVLVASVDGRGRPLLGAVTPGGLGDPLAVLPTVLREPTSALVLGLAVALTAVLAFHMGQSSDPARQRGPSQPVRGRVPSGPPEGHPDEYEGYFPEDVRL